jgi:hypothetical protein
MWIRDLVNRVNPVSGMEKIVYGLVINIPDPQH